MKPKLLIFVVVAGLAALIAVIAWLAAPSQPPLRIPSAEKPLVAATPSVPTAPASTDAPGVDNTPRSTADLATRLAGLHRLPVDEVLAALDELRLPPVPRHILERLLAKSASAEAFAKALLHTWLDYQPDRMIAWSVTNEFPPVDVLAMLAGARRMMQRSTQEDYWPSNALLTMLAEHLSGLPEWETIRPSFEQRMHSAKWAEQNILNAATPEDRANAIRQLAWKWTHTQVADSVDWAGANLSTEEFAAFMASDFTSAQVAAFAPDLALQIVEQMRGTENYALWASSAAFGLVRHQRFDEAVALLETVEGPRRPFALHVMGRYWTIQDHAGALEWINALPPADFAPALEGMYSRLPAPAKAATTQQILARPADPALDLALAEGLRRSAGGLDVASAAELLPQMLAQRSYGPISTDWVRLDGKGASSDSLRSKLWTATITTAHTLAQRSGADAGRAWLDALTFASPEDAALISLATHDKMRTRPLGEVLRQIEYALLDPGKRATLEAELNKPTK